MATFCYNDGLLFFLTLAQTAEHLFNDC
jgi:hypothetical protein